MVFTRFSVEKCVLLAVGRVRVESPWENFVDFQNVSKFLFLVKYMFFLEAEERTTVVEK